MPSPVRRIAPNPSRLTSRSPPILKVELSLGDAAANSLAALPAKSDAPPARAARTNVRRVIPLRSSPFAPKPSSSTKCKVDSYTLLSLMKFEPACVLRRRLNEGESVVERDVAIGVSMAR